MYPPPFTTKWIGCTTNRYRTEIFFNACHLLDLLNVMCNANAFYSNNCSTEQFPHQNQEAALLPSV